MDSIDAQWKDWGQALGRVVTYTFALSYWVAIGNSRWKLTKVMNLFVPSAKRTRFENPEALAGCGKTSFAYSEAWTSVSDMTSNLQENRIFFYQERRITHAEVFCAYSDENGVFLLVLPNDRVSFSATC
jgi:hypothetical protein